MVVLGLILVLLALAAGVLAVYGLPTADANKVSWDLFGNSLSISPTTIFFIGVAAAVALALGLWLMALGVRRSARKSRELRELRREQQHQGRATTETMPTTTPAAQRPVDRVGDQPDRTPDDGSTSWTDTTR